MLPLEQCPKPLISTKTEEKNSATFNFSPNGDVNLLLQLPVTLQENTVTLHKIGITSLILKRSCHFRDPA